MALLQSGCSNTPVPEVEYVYESIRVEVPISEPCKVEMLPIPEYATVHLKKSDSDFDKIKALVVERLQRTGTERELRALLSVCIAP
tara:strand:+ start:1012 stop:1269 length:258 start_codon:yes stop_codon:yes gene_type:complete